MASMTEITCSCGCQRKKLVRSADVKRGWGKYYSKSCKAKEQTRRTGRGKYRNSELSQEEQEHQVGLEGCEGGGWDAHKFWI